MIGAQRSFQWLNSTLGYIYECKSTTLKQISCSITNHYTNSHVVKRIRIGRIAEEHSFQIS